MKLTLTKASVEALQPAPPGVPQVLYYDTRLPGFGVYVTPKGTKTYFAEGKSCGKTVRRKIGRHGVIFPDAARDQARELLFQMSRGEVVAISPKSLLDVMDSYLGTRTSGQGKKIKEKTAAGYQWIRDAVLEKWHKQPLKAINEKFVMELHASLTEKRGPIIANNALRFVRASLNFADVVPNPVAVLTRKRLWNEERRRKRFIKSGDTSDWVKGAEVLDGWMRGAVLTLLFLGLRKDECLTLKQSQVDPASRTIRLEEGTTKNDDAHEVPVGPYLWSKLEPLLGGAPDDWVFKSRKSASGHIVDVRKALEKLQPGISAHDLRRTFVSHLNALEPAPSSYTIKRLMNHRVKLSDITDGYIQIEESLLRDVITRLEAAMVGRS